MTSKLLLISLCLFGAAQCSVLRNYQPDIRYAKIEVDGKQYNLNLKQNLRSVVEDNVPVYVVNSDEEKSHVLTELEYTNRRINGIFYNDEEQMATLLAQYDEEKRDIFYEGLITPGSDAQVVKPTSEEWWREPEVKSAENSEYSEESEQTEQTENLKLRSAFVPAPEGDNTPLEKALTTLQPKILVAVDYPLYKKLGEDINAVFKYVATFFNAVDLRFSKLTSVAVEITVTGIVIVTDENVNEVENAKEYFAGKFIEETGFVNYDTTFALTISDADEALTGKVHLGSICNREFSTIYEQDDAAFGGLHHTIHDLTHLLNVGHNGQGDSEQCNAENTVMAGSKQNGEAIHWSECSNNLIKEFAKTAAASCLEYNYRYD